MNSWQSVKITNPDHPHTGTGGHTVTEGSRLAEVTKMVEGAEVTQTVEVVDVHLDVTNAVETIPVADLQAI